MLGRTELPGRDELAALWNGRRSHLARRQPAGEPGVRLVAGLYLLAVLAAICPIRRALGYYPEQPRGRACRRRVDAIKALN
jgi:hypothetical protein